MKTYLQPAVEIPEYGAFDVVVVGGGFTGVGAAVAAARSGASTAILERAAYFGGTGTAGIMNNINGFRNQVKPDHIQTSRGIAEEVILRLKELNGLGNAAYIQEEYPTTPGRLSFGYAVDPEKLKYVLLRLVVDAGVKCLMRTYFSDVIMEGNQIRAVIAENKSGRFAVTGKVFIDASGDGDVAARAGVPFWQTVHGEAKRLPETLMYRVAGYDPAGRKPSEGCEAGGLVTLWGPRAENINSLDTDELSESEINTRLAVYADLEEQKKKWPWLKDAYLVETADTLGVRQTRFIEGEYKITLEDVLKPSRFEDSIAMASKPIIEYFGYRRYLEHAGYEIPYRCMLPKKVDGLLVAGRCMSSDQPAYESWRSMSPVMCLGQAAGTSAAICAKKGLAPRNVPIRELQDALIAAGAEIGQSNDQTR